MRHVGHLTKIITWCTINKMYSLSCPADGCSTLNRFCCQYYRPVILWHSDSCLCQNVRGVGRMLWNEFGVKTRECYGVSCEGAVIEFVSGSASASLLVESTSGFVLVGPTFPGVPGTGEVCCVFCDRRTGAGVSVTVNKDLSVVIVC